MERKLDGVPVMIVTMILAVLGFFMRRSQLEQAFDTIGVIPGSKMPLIWVAVAVVILFAAVSFLLRQRKKYQALSSTRIFPLAGGCAAGVLMLVSGIVAMLSAEKAETADLIVALGSILAGLCWLGASVLRYRGTKAHAVLYLLPVVFFVVELVCRFRFWTRDPVILDYCFDLFAMIASMCALLHLSGYCFDQGGRRITVFFALCGVFFSAVAMAGAPTAELLGYLAAALWLLVQVWLLLRPMPRKARGEEE